MKKAWPAIFTACAALVLAAASVAAPARHSNVADAQSSQSAAQMQSVSGTIASVETNSFTLNVTTSSSPKMKTVSQDTAPKTMTFKTDKNTTIDGTLKVNANADVTYRTDDSGNNNAVSVRVTPAQ